MEWYQLSEHGVWGHTALAEAEDSVIIPELNLTLTLVQIYEEASVAPLQAGFAAEETEYALSGLRRCPSRKAATRW